MGNKRAKSRHNRSRKRTFHGNQSCRVKVKKPSQPENVPASPEPVPDDLLSSDGGESELDESEAESEEERSSDSDGEIHDGAGNRIFNLALLQQLFDKSSVCNQCKQGELILAEIDRAGLASTFQVTCDHCGHETSSYSVNKSSSSFDLNRKSVLGMRMLGKGREGFRKLCAFLDLPGPVAKKNYQRHCVKLHRAAKAVALDSMKQAADSVLASRVADNEDLPENIAVSTDGTWMRRGHASLYGVQTVMAWDKQKVIDVEILSRHCTLCKSKEAQLRKGQLLDADFQAWKADHLDSCHANTNVSAPTMETEAVKSLWSRSMNVNGLRYTTYIGDGDSKAYRSVCDRQPYGEVPIEKQECIGHVQKRVGKNLLTLKQKCGSKPLGDGKPIGGKGRLTGSKIESLQNYYGEAIRKNHTSTTDMARAIWASVCHNVEFADVTKRHQFCPKGSSSWCRWQRQGGHQSASSSHSPVVSSNSIPEAVFDEIKPIYIRLADKTLLERCCLGATQNANEALNSTIWHLCPKESFCGLPTVETAVFLAVIIWNDGYSRLAKVVDRMGCCESVALKMGLAKSDADKHYHKTRKSSEEQQKARKRRRAVRKGFEDRAKEKEGETYGAGAF